MLRTLRRLWRDESGAVIATEYLLLGTVVAVGGMSGAAAMRDSMIDEYKAFGQDVRQTRQQYMHPGTRSGEAAKGGSAVTNVVAPAVATPADVPGTWTYIPASP